MSDYLKKLLHRRTFLFDHEIKDTITINDNSLMRSWIQNRLREYFIIRDARDHKSSVNHANEDNNQDYSRILKADSFDVMSHELRVFKVDFASSANSLEEDDWNTFMDILMCVGSKDQQQRSDHEPYQTAKANLSVVYQESTNSATNTLHLLGYAGLIGNMSLVEELHPYVYTSEKHTIDVYTKGFPMLEDWANSRGVKITLPSPICYFGKYEENRKVSLEQTFSVQNDILSKVAAGMELDNEVPLYESHRLLLLEDVQRNGFEFKNAENSTFLPLLNVKAALKEISVIHCTSWAFTKVTNKKFTAVCPFIANQHYLPYLKTRIKLVIPKFLRLVADHITKQSTPDKDKLLSNLSLLETKLLATLATSTIPSAGPLCLIHQALNFSTVLFRHSLIPQSQSDPDGHPNPTSSNNKNYSECGDIKSKPIAIQSLNDKAGKTSSSMHIKREVCIVDWKNSTLGSPMIDVAYLLLTSLPPETRKTETPNLLKLYWNEFEKVATRFGLTLPWTAEEIFKEYIQGLLFGCLIIISNSFSDLKHQPDNNGLEIFVHAIRDLIQLQAI